MIEISLKFVPKRPINNIPALVQIMAWHRPGDKPLSEPMMVTLFYFCACKTLQWLLLKCMNTFVAYMSPWVIIEIFYWVQVIASCLDVAVT